jgi:hypothetical protein
LLDIWEFHSTSGDGVPREPSWPQSSQRRKA